MDSEQIRGLRDYPTSRTIQGKSAMTEGELSEDAYRLAAEPKEPLIVSGAGHVDLYDRVNLIPFDKPASFFTRHLK